MIILLRTFKASGDTNGVIIATDYSFNGFLEMNAFRFWFIIFSVQWRFIYDLPDKM